MCRSGVLVLAYGLLGFGQQLQPRPTFAEFPVTKVFRGKPASPKLATKDQRMFRTMIRMGGENPETLNFAGHYTVPQWGCGTDCSQFAVVDSISGRVYGPFAVSGMPGSWLEDHNGAGAEHVEFEPNSRLLKVNGCPNERDCGFYDYVIEDDKGLTLMRKELLSTKYQPGSVN